MLLIKHLESLILERSLERDTENNYRRSIRFFSEWLGHPATIADLEEPTVNAWLKSIEPNRSSRTVLGHKRAITVLWNWLADQNFIRRYDVRRLRAIKVPPLVPTAWTLDNCKALLEGAQNLQGTLKHGVRACDLMTAWVLVGYESGIRPGDLRRLRRESITSNVVSLVQHKTGVPHSFALSDEAIEAISKIQLPNSEGIFPANRNTIRRWELRLYKSAEKFGFTRRKRQGIGTLRKTHGTEVCRFQGLEAAAKSLGHISGTAIAKAHYVAPDALPTPVAPPRLIDGPKERRARTSNRNNPRRAG